MKKLLIAAAIFGMFATEASAEYLSLYPQWKCSKDADWHPEDGVSGSVISTVSKLSEGVFIVRLQEGLPLFLTDKGKSCIDSGLISIGENQQYNDGIAIAEGYKLIITFSSFRSSDEETYKTPGAIINSTMQMIMSYVPRYESYELHKIVLLEKLIADGQNAIINEKTINPKDVLYGFSTEIKP